ncbi:MAG: RtcB family protein [Thermoplasmata archaeon]|nr:RtcB family protein [Thermoplasmata archaeon]
MYNGPLERVDNFRWRIPKTYKKGMRVDGIIFASEHMINEIRKDNAPEQVANVAFLPGIIRASYAMPDIHWGYGFPIGGVAAFDYDEGIISPGGVGYDINCGVKMLRTNLSIKDVQPKIKELIDAIFKEVPSGVGSEGKIKLNKNELNNVLAEGAKWAVSNGFGWEEDLERIEENGRIQNADPSKVSEKAKSRGAPQLGSLGAGNHFLEVQVVDKIFLPEIAKKFGIMEEGQITVMIHTGSRGLGHQVATDYIEVMEDAARKYNIELPDKQLASAPIHSKEAQDYISAMAAAANFGFVNRQMINHWARTAFEKIFKASAEDLDMHVIYSLAHNIAKIEEYEIDGRRKKVIVHRKGATRAFPAGHPALPKIYMDIGQPVLIPGDMGRASYLLVGTDQAINETFGSTCHGAGRVLSRNEALRRYRGEQVKKDLLQKGIYVKSASSDVAAEEAPGAYKNVDDVVEAVQGANISRIIVKMRPLGVMKG